MNIAALFIFTGFGYPYTATTSMGVTQQEIADALDLSLITVHRALNNSGYVSRELKARILAYAKEVRYVPHKASQILKRNKVRKIAVFSSSLPQYFWNDIRTGITIGAEQIQPFNYQVNYHTIAERNSRQYLAKLEEEIRGGLEAVAFVNQWIYDMEAIISSNRSCRSPLPHAERRRPAKQAVVLHRSRLSRGRKAGGGIPRQDAPLQEGRPGARHQLPSRGQARTPTRRTSTACGTRDSSP